MIQVTDWYWIVVFCSSRCKPICC